MNPTTVLNLPAILKGFTVLSEPLARKLAATRLSNQPKATGAQPIGPNLVQAIEGGTAAGLVLTPLQRVQARIITRGNGTPASFPTQAGVPQSAVSRLPTLQSLPQATAEGAAMGIEDVAACLRKHLFSR